MYYYLVFILGIYYINPFVGLPTLRIENDTYHLSILEALIISKLQPSIIKQLTSTHRTLKLFNKCYDTYTGL